MNNFSMSGGTPSSFLSPTQLRAARGLCGFAERLGRAMLGAPGTTQSLQELQLLDSFASKLVDPPIPSTPDEPCRRETILTLLPWFKWGGAERILLRLCEGLGGRFRFIAAATQNSDDNAADAFQRLTAQCYRLGGLGPSAQAAALRRILAAHKVRGLLINWSPEAYRILPGLVEENRLWVGDIIHNTVPEGHLRLSLERDALIDAHFAVGKRQAAALIEADVAPAKVHLANNGVDVEGDFNPDRYREQREGLRAELGFGDSDFLVCWLGRLSKEKDPLLFLRSLDQRIRESPGSRLRGLIVGDGPLMPFVRREIKRLGLADQVLSLGYRERVAEVLAASDALALTSRIEGSPTTIAEAMSMALPVVASGLPGVRDVIDDRIHGFIAAERTPRAFAECYRKLLSRSDRGRSLGAAARRRAVEELSLSGMLTTYEETIKAALSDSV